MLWLNDWECWLIKTTKQTRKERMLINSIGRCSFFEWSDLSIYKGSTRNQSPFTVVLSAFKRCAHWSAQHLCWQWRRCALWHSNSPRKARPSSLSGGTMIYGTFYGSWFISRESDRWIDELIIGCCERARIKDVIKRDQFQCNDNHATGSFLYLGF